MVGSDAGGEVVAEDMALGEDQIGGACGTTAATSPPGGGSPLHADRPHCGFQDATMWKMATDSFAVTHYGGSRLSRVSGLYLSRPPTVLRHLLRTVNNLTEGPRH